MKILAEYLSVIQALENDDTLVDSLLDYKSFCGNHSMFDEFFDSLKDVIMEKAFAEEKSHNEWVHFSD